MKTKLKKNILRKEASKTNHKKTKQEFTSEIKQVTSS